jgi:hypothetical protein
MTGLVRKATLIGAFGLLIAGTAFANVPSPGNSTVPSFIPVVGVHDVAGARVPHNGQSITITVNDFTGNPIAGSAVEIDFSACDDIFLCNLVIPGAGTVVCDVVQATTNGSGQVTLSVVGAANNTSGGAAGAGANCVEVRADGVVLGNATATVVDQNGAAGGNGATGLDTSVAAVDVAQFLANATYKGRTAHFNDPGFTLGGLDLSVLAARIAESLAGTGSGLGCDDGVSSAVYCP